MSPSTIYMLVTIPASKFQALTAARVKRATADSGYGTVELLDAPPTADSDAGREGAQA